MPWQYPTEVFLFAYARRMFLVLAYHLRSMYGQSLKVLFRSRSICSQYGSGMLLYDSSKGFLTDFEFKAKRSTGLSSCDDIDLLEFSRLE